MLGLYIHWPFCQQKCFYCNFLSYTNKEHLIADYTDALKQEIKKVAQVRSWPKVNSVYFGGGNPLVVPTESLIAVLNEVKNGFALTSKAEITVEANPETVTELRLKQLRKAGFNRLSIGAQSFDNYYLKLLGRLHSARQVKQAVKAGFAAGFTNINLDLIYGLPQQSKEQWQQQLKQAVALKVQHISAYALTVEAKTPLAAFNLKLNEEETVKAYLSSLKFLPAVGYKQYELSNFALPGYRCQHNLNYWLGGDYLGFGAGAVSCLAGKRFQREKRLQAYLNKINNKQTTVVASEELSWRQKVGEATVLLLRLNRWSATMLKEKFNLNLTSFCAEEIKLLKKQKLIKANLKLTNKGRLLANEVMSCFV